MPRADQSPSSDWERLNAFADGELAPAGQRAMAERLSASPEAAETLRSIVRLKQELRALPADEAPSPPSLPAPSHPVWRRAGAIAASLIVAAGVAFTPILLRRDASGTFLATSLTAHEQFANAAPQPALTVVPASAVPVVTEFARLGLQPVWQETSTAGDVRIGFVGARGCRLSLHVSPHAGAAPPPDQSTKTLAGWKSSERSYLLIATGMPPERFEMIAGFIKALTSEPADKAEPLRTALQNDWRSAQPCLA